jgi:hypothetical protein
MIPKIIHYCWLSKDPYPEKILHCLDSWNKILIGYKIILWDWNKCEEENIIKFFEVVDDDKGEELDSVIFVSGNVITNDAIIFIPETLSNEFDDDFEVIILNDEGDDVRSFKFSEIECFEGFFPNSSS